MTKPPDDPPCLHPDDPPTDDPLTEASSTEETISRALLAGAYLSAGRSEDAESTYRGILDLDPLFEIDALVEQVDELYGVTVFDGQVEVFRNVRRIR